MSLPDYRAMDAETFDAHVVAVRAEWDRRQTLAHAPARAEQVQAERGAELDRIVAEYRREAGIERDPTDEWSQPTSALEVYLLGEVTTVEGEQWESLHHANSWRPGADPARRWWRNLTTPTPEPGPGEATVWAPGVTYVGPNTRPDQPGDLVTDETGETAWRCKQTHASQAGWAPWDPGMAALWEKVS